MTSTVRSTNGVSRDAFTVPFLRELKRKHEDQVFLATSFGEYNRTTPIRMVGWLRGSPAEVGRDAVATAVMASAGRMPRFDLSTRNMLEIDLRGLPGEDGPSPEYYAAACQLIDRAVKTKAAEAVASEDIIHLSVFAFARLPLLVYLGAQPGDQVPVDVYQKHRSTGDWKWPEPLAGGLIHSAGARGSEVDALLHRALALLTADEDSSPVAASACLALGWVTALRGMPESALRWREKAERCAEGLSGHQARILSARGVSELDLARYGCAYDTSDNAPQLAAIAGDVRQRAWILSFHP